MYAQGCANKQWTSITFRSFNVYLLTQTPGGHWVENLIMKESYLYQVIQAVPLTLA